MAAAELIGSGCAAGLCQPSANRKPRTCYRAPLVAHSVSICQLPRHFYQEIFHSWKCFKEMQVNLKQRSGPTRPVGPVGPVEPVGPVGSAASLALCLLRLSFQRRWSNRWPSIKSPAGASTGSPAVGGRSPEIPPAVVSFLTLIFLCSHVIKKCLLLLLLLLTGTPVSPVRI